MRPATGGDGGRVTVALNLSAGRCTAVENNRQRSTICIVHGDSSTGDPGGLAMRVPGAWTRTGDKEEVAEENSLLVVRTPFLTAEGGEAGTLPYATYTRELAAHVATTLMQDDGAELLTVTHGVSGSGKSIQLFGPTVGGGGTGGEAGQCVYGHGSGLFAAVLQQIFAAADLDPCVAVSVVECRPSSDGGDDSPPHNGTMGHMNDDDGDDDDEGMTSSMEAIDLLARATDTRSPTGCFMEDYADIPATRYVRCGSVAETLAVLQTALFHSLAWQSVSTALSQGCTDVFGLPDTRLDAERRRRAAEAIAEEERPRKESIGASCTSGAADFLRPTAGANSHVLVTLLLRYGGGVTSIWRLWDLSGPSVWVDDGSPASRMAFGTHTALSLMAHRYMHRDQLQGGWWMAAPPPEQVEEIIPLFSTHRPGRGKVNRVVAMIEATMQHSCSAVVWIASLRFDACHDDINGDVLEVAASLLAGADETNGKVIAELRRRRRQENLDAAARVMDMFAVSFSPPHPSGGALVDMLTSTLNASAPMTRTTTTTTSAAASRGPRLISPKKESEKGAIPVSETNINPPAYSAPVALVDASSAAHNAVGVYLPPRSGTAAAAAAVADVGASPWASFVDRGSCLEAQRLHEGPRPPSELRGQQREDESERCLLKSAPLSLLSPPVPSHASSLGEKTSASAKSPCGASPLSPPSVAGTVHPEEPVTTAHELNWREFSWGIAADDAAEASSLAEHALHEGGVDGEGVGQQRGLGALSLPCNGPTDLSGAVRLLLEEPLARLREISTRCEEEFKLHHHRVIARLNTLASSDASTLEELRWRIKALVAAEEEVAARVVHNKRDVFPWEQQHCDVHCHRETAPVEAFGLSGSSQTTPDREVTGRTSSNSSGGGTRPRGCEEGGHQNYAAAVPMRELVAAERKIRFLERQLLRLEGENMRLRAEMSSRRVGCGAATSVQSLEGVFNDILQRCGALYASKTAEVNRMRRRCDALLDALNRLQRRQKEGAATRPMTMTPEEDQVATRAVLQDAEAMCGGAAKPLFAATTNRCHAHRRDCGPHGWGNAAPLVDLVASPPVEQLGDVSAIGHLSRVLLRATTFTTPPMGLPPPQDTSGGVVLSIDHGSNVSFQLREGEEREEDMFTGLRAFREATETARDSVLRALFVAKQTVQNPQLSSPPPRLLPSAACSVDSVGGGNTLLTAANAPPLDAGAALEREEANVYRAVGSLQREAAHLEHTAIEAISRERQLLSRVLLT